MKKTILTVSMAVMLLLAGSIARANENQPEINRETKVMVAFELNSFCKAIMKGDIETVKKLIDLGEDVNQKSLGKTPVHFAARYNRVEVLELLLSNGANVRTLCDKGRSAMDYAKLSGAKEVMDVIESAMIQ